ncbi:FAD-binding oxidoreductase [Sulfurisphaera javensis]|uniref:FAD-binding oxidoreductase n=1 Tax=Sulfurisphaera javensis TaxID=2049879 RepID=A0AAT9GTL4_9CREN
MLLNKLEKEFGSKFVYDEEVSKRHIQQLKCYLIDPSVISLSKNPIGLLKVKDKEDIKYLLEICDLHRIPIVPKGAGTTNFGQLILFYPSILIDMQYFEKKVELLDNNYVRFSAGMKVNEVLSYLRKKGKDLRVYPSSFYFSTLTGFISGGSGGTGSYQYGYYFENKGFRWAKIIGPKGEYELEGKRALAVSQASGTNGIILEAELAVIDYEDWRDQLVKFKDLESAIRFIKEVEKDKKYVRRIAIEDKDTLSIVMKGKIETDNWNVIISSTKSYGEEIDSLKVIETLAGSGIYVMIRNMKIFYNYSHDALMHIPINKFYNVIQPIKKRLGDKVLIHGDVETIKGEVIIDTTIMSEKENFDFIDSILQKEGIKVPFKPPTIVINEWLNDKEKLELMRELKKMIDPHNILNPGKLI